MYWEMVLWEKKYLIVLMKLVSMMLQYFSKKKAVKPSGSRGLSSRMNNKVALSERCYNSIFRKTNKKGKKTLFIKWMLSLQQLHAFI